MPRPFAVQSFSVGPRFWRILIILFLFPLTTCSLAPRVKGEKALRSESGVLDLRGCDFSRARVIPLGGDWEFIFGRHLSPEASLEDAWQEEAVLTKVPSTWKGMVYKGTTLPGQGIATYRLRILSDETTPETLALIIPGWETAYTLFSNGEKIASAGRAGATPFDTIPAWKPQVVHLPVSGTSQELVLHLSNFDHARGGPGMMPFLGRVDSIRQVREKGIGVKLFSFGTLFIISLYHVVIFLLRKKDKSALYFSFFCMIMAVRSLVINEHALVLFLPSIPWSLHIRLTYLPFALAVSSITLFVESLFKIDMNRPLSRLFEILGLLYTGLIIFTPPAVFTSLLAPFQIVILAAAFYCTVVLVIAALRRREGARFFLGAFFIFMLFVVNDVLYFYRLTPIGYIVPLGFLVFIFFQAVVLAKRYSAAFAKVEELFIEKTKLEGTALTLANLSYLDALTGIANRRRLDEYLVQNWGRALRTGEALSVIMMDIDFFKKYNDMFGHIAGDKALIMVASGIKSSIRRPADLIARYGGEEFAVLLPDTDLAGAVAVAESIRQGVFHLGITAADRSVSDNLTISLGCASLKPQPDLDPTDLVKAADTALYLAKARGRNRVEPQESSTIASLQN